MDILAAGMARVFGRIDNDGHYSKENLRAVPRIEKLRNTRSSKGSIRDRAESCLRAFPHVTFAYRTVGKLIQQKMTPEEILPRFEERRHLTEEYQSENPKSARSRRQLNPTQNSPQATAIFTSFGTSPFLTALHSQSVFFCPLFATTWMTFA